MGDSAIEVRRVTVGGSGLFHGRGEPVSPSQLRAFCGVLGPLLPFAVGAPNCPVCVALIIAGRHVGNGSDHEASALECMVSARKYAGAPSVVITWCIRSLSYSVGIFHADYKVVKALEGGS